jgi:hypothetical protein
VSLSNSASADYFDDFEGTVGPEWSPAVTDGSQPALTTFLGRYNNTFVDLTLPAQNGNDYLLSFDLYIIDSWDGSVHNDIFNVIIDDVSRFSETFTNTAYGDPANFDDYQSFPEPLNPRTDIAFEAYLDAIYHIDIPFTASGSTMTIRFQDLGLQPLNDESWGIDNVAVTPEPTTIVLLGLGGLMLRRRKKA